MKRVVTILVSIALLIAICIVGCSSGDKAAGTEEKDWPKSVSIATVGTGGSYFAIGSGLGKMIEMYLDVPVAITNSSGAEETARLINTGDAHLGFITPDVGNDAERGLNHFEELGPVPIRAVIQDYPLTWNILTMEGSGIESVADLKNKVGYYTRRGSPVQERIFDNVLDAYGLTREDLKATLIYDTDEEWQDALKVGKIDFTTDMGVHPTAKYEEMAITHPLKAIEIDDAHMEKIQQKLPWVFGTNIPGGTYKTMPEDIQVATVSIYIAIHADMPEDFVYELTKMVWENFDEFAAIHPVAALFSPEAVERTNFAYHEGAIKYYKEIGLWTEELDERQARILAEIKNKL
jgi:TRAP transporter TAXI family solute receptor